MARLYTVEVLLTFLLFLSSTVIFSQTTWYKSWAGRFIFGILANFTIVLGLIVVNYWVWKGQSYPASDIARFVVYTLTFLNSVIIFTSIFVSQFRFRTRKVSAMTNANPTADVLPPSTNTKAYVAAGASAVVAFLTAIIAGLSDDVLTTAEWLTAAVAAIGASGLTGVATWAVPNKPK